jgi:beta-lactam-binding protein with PASTA domain
MAAFVVLVFVGVLLWLKVYTNHGQKLELPNYKEMQLDKAKSDAKDKSFEIIVKDSLYKVGVPGGQILTQNPIAGSLVKENRKVYVDIARYNATVNKLADLPMMYGREYNGVKRSLAHLEINSKIARYKHDIGEPDHILEVYYNNKLVDGKSGKTPNVEIKTGGTLEFVLSNRQGGSSQIPDLRCKRMKTVKFILGKSFLKLGEIEKRGAIELNKMDSTFVISQFPPYTDSTSVDHGTTIDIVIRQGKPDNCK